MPRRSLNNMTLLAISDRELLHIVNDLSDADGWTTAEAIVGQLGIEALHPSSCVGTRFGWLRKYGVLERDEEGGQGRWRLTDAGTGLMNGNLKARVAQTFENLEDAEVWTLANWLGNKRRGMADEAAVMVRREMQRELRIR